MKRLSQDSPFPQKTGNTLTNYKFYRSELKFYLVINGSLASLTA